MRSHRQRQTHRERCGTVMPKRERCECPVKIALDKERTCQFCNKIWLKEKLTFIRITYLMFFKTSKGCFSKFKTFLRP
mgnify:CR=1 FL=1